jgi:hypothetical protein
MIEFARFQGSFRSTTIEGPITGFGLNLGVLDDYVKGRAEANSKGSRDKTWLWFTDNFLTRFSKDSAFLGIATRWHIDDLFGRLQKKWPEIRMLNFPALAEKDEGWRQKGDPLFPEHRPKEMWLDQKRVMSEASWAAEYQGHPFLVGSGEIPIEKLKIISYFDRADISATVLSVDKAGTEGGDGAQTAIVIMHKMKNGTFVIEKIIAGHWGALEREKYILAWSDFMKNELSRYGVSFKVVVEQEPGSGGKDLYLHAGQWVPDFIEEAGNFPQGSDTAGIASWRRPATGSHRTPSAASAMTAAQLCASSFTTQSIRNVVRLIVVSNHGRFSRRSRARRCTSYRYCEPGHAAAWRSLSPIRSPRFRRSSHDDLRDRSCAE